MISSLLHLVGLRPRVCYSITNFKECGGGGTRLVAPPPQYANERYGRKLRLYKWEGLQAVKFRAQSPLQNSPFIRNYKQSMFYYNYCKRAIILIISVNVESPNGYDFASG